MGEVKLLGVIKPAMRLWGIRYWAAWTDIGSPRFVVFSYAGHDRDKGLHYFKNKKTQAFFARNEHQIQDGINSGYFRPFVYDTKFFEEFL